MQKQIKTARWAVLVIDQGVGVRVGVLVTLGVGVMVGVTPNLS